MTGPVLLVILIFGGGGFALFAYEKGKRVIAWLLGFTAFLLVASVAVWREALASLIGTGRGIAVLGALDVILLLAFYFEAFRAHKHHRIRTPVIGVLFGTCAALTLGASGQILRQLGKAPAGTGRALSMATHQISTGKAAHAMPQQHAYEVLVIGALILVALIVAGVRIKGKGPGPSPARKGGFLGGKSSRPPVPGAGNAPALPRGR